MNKRSMAIAALAAILAIAGLIGLGQIDWPQMLSSTQAQAELSASGLPPTATVITESGRRGEIAD